MNKELIVETLTKSNWMVIPIALIAVKIPQQALGKARREELQRKAGSRLQVIINDNR